MKTLKFRDFLIKKILDGSKTVTWRLFDDKDLQAGDEIVIRNWNTGEDAARAEITEVREKKLGELEPADFEGHEKYENEAAMYRHYHGYYGGKVNADTMVKIVTFKLIS